MKQLYSLLPLTRPNGQVLTRTMNLKEVVNKLCDVMFGSSEVINKKLAELCFFNVLTLKIMNRYNFIDLPIDDTRQSETYWKQTSAYNITTHDQIFRLWKYVKQSTSFISADKKIRLGHMTEAKMEPKTQLLLCS